MVWINGLEPSTPCMSSRYSNQLSYTHIFENRYYYISICSKNQLCVPTNITAKICLYLSFLLFFSVFSRRFAVMLPKGSVKGLIA